MYLAPQPTYTAQLIGAPSGAAGSHNTLRLMRQMIRDGKTQPAVLQAAHSAIFNTAERDDAGEVSAIFAFVRDHIRYVKDVHGVETLCAPAMTLQRMLGDCDDQTMLLCAMLESCGYPTRLVMAEYESGSWEHVYCQVFVRGDWFDCDPIERSAVVGWAPPSPRRVFTEKV